MMGPPESPAGGHWDVLGHTGMYWEALRRALGMHWAILVCTGLYWALTVAGVRVHLGLHWDALGGTGLYWSVLVYTGL